MERELVDLYIGGLRAADGWRHATEQRLVIKRKQLLFPLDERSIYYLLRAFPNSGGVG
jgi:hypothetical protein